MPIFLIARFARRWRRYKEIGLLLTAVTILLIGGLLFSLTQHLSIGVAMYWAITTATTVGYGDVLPHNTVGRIIASFVTLTTIRWSVPTSAVSRPLSLARARSDALVLGVCKDGKVDLGVSDDPILSADDRLIVLSTGAA